MKTAVRVRRVSSKKELEQAFSIRLRVFVTEQGVPKAIEMDGDDERALHFLAFVGEKPVGTARVVMAHRRAKIGRMAVLKSCRGRGVGKELLKRAVATARRRGAEMIYLHAQVPVVGFYEILGFQCAGPVFKEAGIPHRKMILVCP